MIRVSPEDLRAVLRGGRSALAAANRLNEALERYDADQLPRPASPDKPQPIEPYDIEIDGKTYRVTNLRYHLRGRVPVKTEGVEDGGCAVLAFNPLLGGFVYASRYYFNLREDDEWITRERYDAQVQLLQEEWGKRDR